MNAVQEIHHAVDLANEELINPLSYEASHSITKQLEEMGFTDSKNVLDELDYNESHKYALQYRQRYPQFKFITVHQLSAICLKYGLKHDSFGLFKGEIPTKNAKELIEARIMAKDIDVDFIEAKESVSGPFAIALKKGQDPSDAIRSGLDNLLGSLKKDLENKKQYEAFKKVDPLKFMSISEINKVIPSVLIIAADPILFSEPKRFVCPMPAVMVKGGLLIITAWGAEASDPDVANERMN